MTELLKSPSKSGVDKGGGSNKLLFCLFTCIVNSTTFPQNSYVIQCSVLCFVFFGCIQRMKISLQSVSISRETNFLCVLLCRCLDRVPLHYASKGQDFQCLVQGTLNFISLASIVRLLWVRKKSVSTD